MLSDGVLPSVKVENGLPADAVLVGCCLRGAGILETHWESELFEPVVVEGMDPPQLEPPTHTRV